MEPKKEISRWYILILCSSIIFGTYYAYDVPAALNLQLHDYLAFGNQYFQYYLELLYSLYSIPNLFLPFFGGYLVDKIGNRYMLIITALLTALGQLFFTLGLFIKSTLFMYIGRLTLGIGGETLGVVQSSIATNWFQSKELGLAIGINILVGRMGSVLNDLVTPWIGNTSVVLASVVASLFCIFSLISAAILAEVERFYPGNHMISKSSIAINRSNFNFSTGFWIICCLIIFIEGPMVPFNNIHAELLALKFFEGEKVYSSQIMAIPDTLSAILIPPIGFLIDKYGFRIRFLFLCAGILSLFHLYLMFIPINSSSFEVYPLLFFLGIAYAIAVILYTCVPLVVRTRQIGMAFGITSCAWNLSSLFFPLIVAALVSSDPSFTSTEYFFVLSSCSAIILLLFLDTWDNRSNNDRLSASQIMKRTDSSETYAIVQDSDIDEQEMTII